MGNRKMNYRIQKPDTNNGVLALSISRSNLLKEGEMKDLVNIMAEGTMKAYVLQATERGITKEQINANANNAVAKMREIMKAEWDELTQTLKDALDANMGDAMYKQVINIYCNAWAVKALV